MSSRSVVKGKRQAKKDAKKAEIRKITGKTEIAGYIAKQPTAEKYTLAYLTKDFAEGPNANYDPGTVVGNKRTWMAGKMHYVANILLNELDEEIYIPKNTAVLKGFGIKQDLKEITERVQYRAGKKQNTESNAFQNVRSNPPVDNDNKSTKEMIRDAIVPNWLKKAHDVGAAKLGREQIWGKAGAGRVRANVGTAVRGRQVSPVKTSFTRAFDWASGAAPQLDSMQGQSPMQVSNASKDRKAQVELLRKIEKNTSKTPERDKTETNKRDAKPVEDKKSGGKWGILLALFGGVLFGFIKRIMSMNPLLKLVFSTFSLLTKGLGFLIGVVWKVGKFLVGPLMNALVGLSAAAFGAIKKLFGFSPGGAGTAPTVPPGRPTTVPPTGAPGTPPPASPAPANKPTSRAGNALKAGARALGTVAAAGAAGWAGWEIGTAINDKLLTNENGEGIIGTAVAEWMHKDDGKYKNLPEPIKEAVDRIVKRVKDTGIATKGEKQVLDEAGIELPKDVKIVQRRDNSANTVKAETTRAVESAQIASVPSASMTTASNAVSYGSAELANLRAAERAAGDSIVNAPSTTVVNAPQTVVPQRQATTHEDQTLRFISNHRKIYA